VGVGFAVGVGVPAGSGVGVGVPAGSGVGVGGGVGVGVAAGSGVGVGVPAGSGVAVGADVGAAFAGVGAVPDPGVGVAAADRPLGVLSVGRMAWGTALADTRGATLEELRLLPGSVSWPGGISHMVAATVSISVPINARRPNLFPPTVSSPQTRL
jgi:hypothetical protein